jgi:CRP-like cAMP-binding protein
VSTNKLLARLSHADAQLLEPHLSPIELPVRKQLQAANKRVDRIYFPESGIASIVSNGPNPIEVGMIGREGMTGALGVRRSGITTALQELERKGLIVHRRTIITIADREGLEESSNGAYLPPYDNS